jgi:hypothetical protein
MVNMRWRELIGGAASPGNRGQPGGLAALVVTRCTVQQSL